MPGNDGPRPDAAQGGRADLARIRMATWNVGSMSGRAGEVADAMWRRRVDFCSVQETRWRGSRARWLGSMGRRYKFLWQGSEDGTAGVGVLVAEKWVDQILSVNRVNERIMLLKVVNGKNIMNIVSAYAPQVGRTEEEKDKFWDEAITVLSGIPPGEAVILGGDLNGHVGAGADGYDGVHGGMGYGTRNGEGERILEFCDAMGLMLCNTFFKKDENKLVTYSSGGRKSMIDYIMVKRQDRAKVKDVKVLPSEECVQQHRLLVVDLALRSRRAPRKKHVPRLKIWKLKEANIGEEFKKCMAEDNECVRETSGSEEKWKAMRKSWIGAAEKVCGWTKGPARHKETWWWNDEVAEVIEEKRKLYTEWYETKAEADRVKYVEVKRRARNAVWRAKKDKQQEFAEELEEGKRSIYKVARQMAKEGQDVTGTCCMRDTEGIIRVDNNGVKKIWQEYMEKLLNVENEWDKQVECDLVQGPSCRIEEEEVAKALKCMKKGKAAGPSGVVVEMMAAGGDLTVEWMTDLLNNIIEEGRIPTDWTKSTLVPLYKGKGDPLQCGSYRAIKLLEQGMKVMERVLEKRVRSQVKIDDMQFGFMPGKGTTDAIFITRQMQEKHQAKKKRLYYAFVDLEKAFDRVPREVVRWALRMSGVEEWLVNAVMTLYQDASTVVRTDMGDSKDFKVEVGVHQGSVLSPLLFAVVMDVVTREAREGLPWELLYADDLVIVATSREELQRKVKAWRDSLTRKGLKVNEGKTKIMIGDSSAGVMSESGAHPCGVCGAGVGANSIQCTGCRKWVHRRCSGVKGALSKAAPTFRCRRCEGEVPQANPANQEGLTVDGETYGLVESFCYLGDVLDASGGVDSAVRARVRCGWKKFHELSPFLTSKAPSPKMKGLVYSACVRSCMTYGAETWPLRRDHERTLEKTENRMIRWMNGVSLKDRRTSKELREKVQVENILDVVRRARLRWFGHVERKSDEDWVKRITHLKVEGNRPAGRPKKTWQDTIKADLRQLKLDPSEASNRASWRRAIHAAESNPAETGNRT